MKLKKMITAAFSAVFIAVCSWIVIPTPIPFSMQTFGIFLLLFIFGGRKCLFSILIYTALGLLGAPVFAGFRGGIPVIFSNTGGYLAGFILCAFCYIIISPSGKKSFIAAVIGLCICYICGTLWYMMINSLWSFEGLKASFTICVLPFIIPDFIKLFLAFKVSGRLSSVIYRLNNRR